MTTPWSHPELLPLLRAAKSAEKLLDNAVGDARLPIEEALRDIQLELGKRVLQLNRDLEDPSDGPTPLEPIVQGPVVVHASEPETVELDSKADTFDEPDVTPIPESTPLPADIRAFKRRLAPPVSSPESMGIPALPEGRIKPWMRTVIQAMHLMEAPRVVHAYTDLSVENARLLWASQILDGYFGRIPNHLTGPLLNVLAARCHHLSSQIELQWGPEATLSILNRVAEHQSLAHMNAFSATPTPEYQTWHEDALHWWDVLAHGMRAQLK